MRKESHAATLQVFSTGTQLFESLPGKHTILIIRDFTQSFHHIPLQYPHFGHDRFFPHAFQLIIPHPFQLIIPLPFQFIIHVLSSSLKDSDDGVSLKYYRNRRD